VEFSPADLSLTPMQRDKLIKLSGARYNPSTQIVKMSCENFDTQAQNKRFLGERIHALIAEAKDSKDTFADVPFDFRHHKPKPHYAFPKEWVLTPERKKALAEKRAEAAKLQDQRLHNGELVDGRTVIETSLPFLEKQAEPVLVAAPRGKGR
jgi:small subunit ribosomal protein S35